MQKTMLDALSRAVEICGTQAELARRLSSIGAVQQPPMICTSGHVWAWMNRDGKVSELWARHVEMAVTGRVTRYDLRPDVFGQAEARAA